MEQSCLKAFAWLVSTLAWGGMVSMAIVGVIAVVVVLVITHPPNGSDDGIQLRWKNLWASIWVSLVAAMGMLFAVGHRLMEIGKSWDETTSAAVVFRAIKFAITLPPEVSMGDIFLLATLNFAIIIWWILAVLVLALTPRSGVRLEKWKIGKGEFEAPVPLHYLALVGFIALIYWTSHWQDAAG